MKFLWSVLVLSGVSLAAALTLPGLSDWALLAAPCLIASAWLLLRGRGSAPAIVVVDGSNVMHWGGGEPSLAPVRAVVASMKAGGFRPCVIFDANAGYRLEGRYRGDRALAGMLGLPERRVMVVPKGTPADPYILQAARNLGARVVSNDRYRDWAADYPEVQAGDLLVRGGYRDGELWLDEAEFGQRKSARS